jgi:ABC-type sugar transport system permease subunit
MAAQTSGFDHVPSRPLAASNPTGGAPGSGRSPSRRSRREGARSWSDGYLIAPAVVLVCGLILVPTATVIYRSLFDWQPGYSSQFVGLDNFTHLFASPQFHKILANEGVYLLGIPVYTLAPLVIALILFEGAKGSALFRTIVFFPSILSPTIIGIMFRSVLAQDGMVNAILADVGLTRLQHDWLNDAALVKPTLIAVIAWALLGVGVLIFSSALSALPTDTLEAALIDGASWWQRLRFIVIPELAPTIQLWLGYQVIVIFTGIFGWIYVLTNGGPNQASTTLDYDIYQNSLEYGFFGLAAAEAVVLLALILGLLTIAVGARAVANRVRTRQFKAA